MADRPDAGRLLFCGFEGTTIPRDLAQRIAEGRIGGVILFARNIVGPAQLRALVDELHALDPERRLVVCIDQEGGRVQRLRAPWTEWPPMRQVGDLDDLETTARVARALARELGDLGIGLDFAPCVDVDTTPRTRSSATAALRATRRGSRPTPASSCARCRRRGWRPAQSTSRATATRRRTAI